MFVEMMNLSTSIPKGSHVYRCDTRMTCDPFGVEQYLINISTNIESVWDSFYKKSGDRKTNCVFIDCVVTTPKESNVCRNDELVDFDPEGIARL